MKFRGDRSALKWSAAAIGALIDPLAIDVVTWAPTSASRARRRGADQAETLAWAVGHRLGLPVRRLLGRLPGPAQANRTRADRKTGVAFTATGSVGRLRVVVVDDVVTTGATLHAACGALLDAGAGTVFAVALTRADRSSACLPGK